MLKQDGGLRPTLFLAGRNEVSFEEVYGLLKHALLGASAMRHCIDVGLNRPSVLTNSFSQSCIIAILAASMITVPASLNAHT